MIGMSEINLLLSDFREFNNRGIRQQFSFKITFILTENLKGEKMNNL